jgi:hypothetical protein
VQNNGCQAVTNRTRGALPFTADPAARRVGPAGARGAAGTSAGIASGTANKFSSNDSSSIRAEHRFRRRTVRANVLTPVPTELGHRAGPKSLYCGPLAIEDWTVSESIDPAS